MKYVERYSNRATETSFTFEEDSRTLKNLMGYFRNFLLERQEVKGRKPRLGGNVSKLTFRPLKDDTTGESLLNRTNYY